MKQKLIIILAAAVMALSCTFAFAACSETPTADNGDTPYPDENAIQGLEFALNDDSYWVIGIGTCTDTEIVIPSQYNGLPVTGIFEQAFAGTNDLASIEIPDSVTYIGNYAFMYCSSLTSITLHGSVTSIGNYAFYNCSSLTSITIPDSVTNIGGWAFAGTAYSIDENNWENDIFYVDNHLIGAREPLSGECIIRNGTKVIVGYAFQDCENVTNISIPDSVITIGDSASSGCSNLISITIGNGVTSIGNYAFENCSSLTSIEIPDSITSIGSSVFSDCSSLTNITIPDNVTSIGSSVFSDCSSLTNITIPDNVTSIGDYAFCYCSSLTSITIPDSVTSIGDYAFDGCNSLTSVMFENTEGWTVDGEPIDVTNPVQNAVYLTDTYLWYTWTRGE